MVIALDKSERNSGSRTVFFLDYEPPRVSRRLICLSPDWFGWDVLRVVEVFELCWRDIAEFTEDAAVVEPVNPFDGGEFEIVETTPYLRHHQIPEFVFGATRLQG